MCHNFFNYTFLEPSLVSVRFMRQTPDKSGVHLFYSISSLCDVILYDSYQKVKNLCNAYV